MNRRDFLRNLAIGVGAAAVPAALLLPAKPEVVVPDWRKVMQDDAWKKWYDLCEVESGDWKARVS